jgi:hypothetical protein
LCGAIIAPRAPGCRRNRDHLTRGCAALGVSISEQLLLQGELPDEAHGGIALRESNLHDICG